MRAKVVRVHCLRASREGWGGEVCVGVGVGGWGVMRSEVVHVHCLHAEWAVVGGWVGGWVGGCVGGWVGGCAAPPPPPPHPTPPPPPPTPVNSPAARHRRHALHLFDAPVAAVEQDGHESHPHLVHSHSAPRGAVRGQRGAADALPCHGCGCVWV